MKKQRGIKHQAFKFNSRKCRPQGQALSHSVLNFEQLPGQVDLHKSIKVTNHILLSLHPVTFLVSACKQLKVSSIYYLYKPRAQNPASHTGQNPRVIKATPLTMLADRGVQNLAPRPLELAYHGGSGRAPTKQNHSNYLQPDPQFRQWRQATLSKGREGCKRQRITTHSQVCS